MALDGISYLTTQKSLTDHGLSVVSQKDCALWRGVTEGQICRDIIEQSPGLMTAEADPSQRGEKAILSSPYLNVI